MTYVFSVGVLLGVPGCRRYADHGVQALTNAFWDETNGGWFSAIEGELDEDGHGRPAPGFTRKECYQHAFVLLGAATALAAGVRGRRPCLSGPWRCMSVTFLTTPSPCPPSLMP